MASTRKLSDVANWASTFVGLQPLAGQNGLVGEPAITIGNCVRGFILSPPFAWRWNRKRAGFSSVLSTGSSTQYDQSYQIALSDFGWLESATISDGTTIWPLEVRLLTEDTTDADRPKFVSAEWDDDAGNITFKLFPAPDKVYTVKLIYQKKPVMFTKMSDPWDPIPDEDQYLYNSGFLAYAFENFDDGRFTVEYGKFIRLVIAKSEGLQDTQKAIFLEEKLLEMRQQQNSLMGAQQGRGARGGQ